MRKDCGSLSEPWETVDNKMSKRTASMKSKRQRVRLELSFAQEFHEGWGPLRECLACCPAQFGELGGHPLFQRSPINRYRPPAREARVSYRVSEEGLDNSVDARVAAQVNTWGTLDGNPSRRFGALVYQKFLRIE